MGNHDVGRAMAAWAKGFWAGWGTAGGLPPKEVVLRSMDAAAEPYRGADAEFDDEADSARTPLGRLLAIAFDWQQVLDRKPDLESLDELWYEEVYAKFSKRYDFT